MLSAISLKAQWSICRNLQGCVVLNAVCGDPTARACPANLPFHYQGGISPTLLIACETPQSASNAATIRPAHDTLMGMLRGPIVTDHPRMILTRCMIATMAKIKTVTAA
jgi:hypothetical protein